MDTTEQALQVLAAEPAPGARAAGVMIGRAAWKRPWDCFSDADRAVFQADSNAAVSRRQVSSCMVESAVMLQDPVLCAAQQNLQT